MVLEPSYRKKTNKFLANPTDEWMSPLTVCLSVLEDPVLSCFGRTSSKNSQTIPRFHLAHVVIPGKDSFPPLASFPQERFWLAQFRFHDYFLGNHCGQGDILHKSWICGLEKRAFWHFIYVKFVFIAKDPENSLPQNSPGMSVWDVLGAAFPIPPSALNLVILKLQ